jgi:hypothetical protein
VAVELAEAALELRPEQELAEAGALGAAEQLTARVPKPT